MTIVPNALVDQDGSRHLLIFTYEAWGHARTLCNIAARVVKATGMHVTYITTQGILDRLKLEIARNFSTEEAHLIKLIRIVGILQDGPTILHKEATDANFAATFKKLARAESVECAITGTTFDPLPSPHVAIIDFCALGPFMSMRKYSPRPMKILCNGPGCVAFWHYCFGSADYGGRGNLRPQVDEEAACSDKHWDVVANDVLLRNHGKLLNIPGLPPMYDYELMPQSELMDGLPVGRMWVDAHDVISQCDGFIVNAPECFETEAINAFRQWFSDTNRHFYVVGPLLPTGNQAAENEKKMSAKSSDIATFLDSALKSRGEKSVLYISFGSIFWPTNPEVIWHVLDVVMSMGIPFIFSYGSPLASVPDSVHEKVKAYGLGILSKWSPQQYILQHPATGWFLTHGGNNSVLESLAAGIPMIVWPFHADQGAVAAHVTHTIEVGYELFEIRTGEGLQPIHRTGKTPTGTMDAVKEEAKEVLTTAFGRDGEEKRKRAMKMQNSICRAWAEEGPSKREFDAMISVMVN